MLATSGNTTSQSINLVENNLPGMRRRKEQTPLPVIVNNVSNAAGLCMAVGVSAFLGHPVHSSTTGAAIYMFASNLIPDIFINFPQFAGLGVTVGIAVISGNSLETYVGSAIVFQITSSLINGISRCYFSQFID